MTEPGEAIPEIGAPVIGENEEQRPAARADGVADGRPGGVTQTKQGGPLQPALP